MGTLIRAALACAICVGFCLIGQSPAAGHAELVASTPSAGEVLAAPPEQIVLEFAEPLAVDQSEVRVRDSQGRTHRTDTLTSLSGEVLVAVMEPDGPDGAWSVDYKAVSTDWHSLSGTIVFSVGESASLATFADPGQLGWLVPGLLLLLVVGFSLVVRMMPDDAPWSEA